MRREAFDSSTIETSSSIGTLDSIKAAFDSLDAASISDQHQQDSSQSAHNSVENQNRTHLRAFRRQSVTAEENVSTDDKSFRPLCGGPSKAEMLKRAKGTVRIDREASIANVHPSDPSDRSNHMQPFSGSNLASPQAYDGVNVSSDIVHGSLQITPASRMSDNRTDTNEQRTENKRNPTDIDVRSGPINHSPQKKRNLLWAAKRDRRNARRRASPPMTRRRAALASSKIQEAVGESENRVCHTQDEINMNKSFPSIAETSIDITDPSNGDQTIQDALKHNTTTKEARKKIQSHPRTALPQLDMTLTEPDLLRQYDQGSHCEDWIHKDAITGERGARCRNHEQSSDTETEDERSESRPTIVRAISSGSNTEEEHEIVSKRAEANKSKNAIKNAVGGSGEKKKATKPKRSNLTRRRKELTNVALEQEEEKSAGTQQKRQEERKKSSSKMQKRYPKEIPKGRPLFEGFTFVIIGFWANVEKYTKLIEKHGGKMVKVNESLASSASFVPLSPQFDHSHLPDTNPEETITHIIYCPHGTYIPDPDIVREAILRWKKENGRDVSYQKVGIVDSRWISDCISKCLRKEDLLSANEYRIQI